jgi:hypothetical protein
MNQDPELFHEEGVIYGLYPRKVGRREALKSIHSALQRIHSKYASLYTQPGNHFNAYEWLKIRVELFAESPAGQHHGLFCGYHPPHPATWFNQERYEDDSEEWYAVDARGQKETRNRVEANIGVYRPK